MLIFVHCVLILHKFRAQKRSFQTTWKTVLSCDSIDRNSRSLKEETVPICLLKEKMQ
jgi:hypothetical protein